MTISKISIFILLILYYSPAFEYTLHKHVLFKLEWTQTTVSDQQYCNKHGRCHWS